MGLAIAILIALFIIFNLLVLVPLCLDLATGSVSIISVVVGLAILLVIWVSAELFIKNINRRLAKGNKEATNDLRGMW